MTEGKIIHWFRILHEGWESDNEGWVVEYPNGKRELLTTNHGEKCVMSKDELKDKIKETRRSLNGLLEAEKLVIEGEKKND
jgi:hypothetical protein